jgi:hypothetical protein
MPKAIWRGEVLAEIAEKIRGMVAFWRGVQVLSLLGLLTLAAPIEAQEAATPPPPPCSAPEHRQFDFWIGDWDVTGPDGEAAGTNRITSILGGCVLHESWKAANGPHAGQSFNILGRDGRWHQTWVDNSGLLLELAGGLDKGRMVMGQERTRPDGKTVRHEISWERLANGQVRQHWRSSVDGGQTWRDVFVGIYTRKK